MALIRKLLILLALVHVPMACTEESTKKNDVEAHPAVAELLTAIEEVELAMARGLTLTSATPETGTVFKRILNRSKAGAGLLKNSELDLEGLTDLVRSRDELRNIVFLSEDVDVIGIYKKALEKTVTTIAQVQGQNAYDLADPNVYHELYLQNFNLEQKLGEFSTFVETRDTKGPKLFVAGTCGDACGNQEYVSSDVNKNQTVWLVSPRLSLPDSPDLKVNFAGYVKGEVDSKNKNFRVYVSESFDGRFTKVDEGWTDVTDLIDRYLPTGGKGSNFTCNIWLEKFRGKTLTFAFRVKGVSNTPTNYQLRTFSLMGKGHAEKTLLTLVAPEPLLLVDPTPTPTPTPGPTPTGTPQPSFLALSGGKNFDAVDKICSIPVDGSTIEITESCRIPFDADRSKEDFLPYTDNSTPAAISPFRKVMWGKDPAGWAYPTKGGGWRGTTGTSCSARPTNAALLTGFCLERTNSISWDMLISPKIKLKGDYIIKLWHAPLGPTINKPAAGQTVNVINRFRLLAFEEGKPDATFDVTNFDGLTAPFVLDSNVYDIPFGAYPTDPVIAFDKATLIESVVDINALKARAGSDPKEFRLALLQSLMGDKQTQTAWYVYAITFKAVN